MHYEQLTLGVVSFSELPFVELSFGHFSANLITEASDHVITNGILIGLYSKQRMDDEPGVNPIKLFRDLFKKIS